jgi:CheY-like chemotaxis protein
MDLHRQQRQSIRWGCIQKLWSGRWPLFECPVQRDNSENDDTEALLMEKPKLRCVLVDDEPKAIATLKNLIELFTPQLEVKATFENIQEAKASLEEGDVDVAFLGVEMPGGGGFELLKHFEYPDFKVIFVTAFDQYAIKAYA